MLNKTYKQIAMKNIFYKSIIFFGFSFLLLTGCKPNFGKISDVKKTIIFPGVPQGKTFMKYSAKLDLEKPIEIISVDIINNEKIIPVKIYSIVNLKTGKINRDKKHITQGSYLFETHLESNENLEKGKDKLRISFKYHNKKYVVEYDVSQDKAFFSS